MKTKDKLFIANFFFLLFQNSVFADGFFDSSFNSEVKTSPLPHTATESKEISLCPICESCKYIYSDDFGKIIQNNNAKIITIDPTILNLISKLEKANIVSPLIPVLSWNSNDNLFYLLEEHKSSKESVSFDINKLNSKVFAISMIEQQDKIKKIVELNEQLLNKENIYNLLEVSPINSTDSSISISINNDIIYIIKEIKTNNKTFVLFMKIKKEQIEQINESFINEFIKKNSIITL